MCFLKCVPLNIVITLRGCVLNVSAPEEKRGRGGGATAAGGVGERGKAARREEHSKKRKKKRRRRQRRRSRSGCVMEGNIKGRHFRFVLLRVWAGARWPYCRAADLGRLNLQAACFLGWKM